MPGGWEGRDHAPHGGDLLGAEGALGPREDLLPACQLSEVLRCQLMAHPLVYRKPSESDQLVFCQPLAVKRSSPLQNDRLGAPKTRICHHSVGWYVLNKARANSPM